MVGWCLLLQVDAQVMIIPFMGGSLDSKLTAVTTNKSLNIFS